MRHSFFNSFAIVLISLVALAACEPQEGVVDHRQRIDQIYASEKATLGNHTLYEFDNLLAEQWNWDGDVLYRIDYQFSTTYSENIFYDSRNRIVRTTVPAYRQQNLFFYDGRHLSHIDCFVADSMVASWVFVHDENVLTKVQHIDYHQPDDKRQICNPLSRLMGVDIASAMTVGAQFRRAQTKGDGAVSTDFLFEWDANDNVSRITYNDGAQTQHIDLTYDDKHNPYSELYTNYMMEETIFGFTMMSKHNILTMRMPYGLRTDQLFTYTYQYQDDYPVSRHLHYSYTAVDATDWSEALYDYNKTENYSYR